jgi:flagellar hook-basal body complex protein FliE
MNDLLVQPGIGQSPHQVGDRTIRKEAGGFSEYVKEALENVNELQAKANRSIEQMTTGQTGIHETMIAVEKAGISLRLILQVRNKALEAYREIIRMPF